MSKREFPSGYSIVDQDHEIDKGIIKICEKLNSFDGVKTHHSCEGHIGKNNHGEPSNGSGYISFTCTNDATLVSIMMAIARNSNFVFDPFYYIGDVFAICIRWQETNNIALNKRWQQLLDIVNSI